MPLIPSKDFNRAKKRMQQGLHPAVVAAVNRALQPEVQVMSNRLEPGVSAGAGVNQQPGRTIFGRQAPGSRHGLQYQRFLRQGPGGVIQEVHDYGGKADAQVFTRKPTPEIQALLAQSPAQQMSNTATAEDKLLAMAVRHAAAGNLAGRVGVKRRFSRNPGPLQRL